MKKRKKTMNVDSSVTVTISAKNELEAIRRYQKQTKKLCLEEIIHEKYLTLPKEYRDFFIKNCDIVKQD